MLRGVIVLRHQGGRREHCNAGLTDTDHMGARAEEFEKAHNVLDVFVQPEAALRELDVTCVMPVGDVNIVIRQQRSDGITQQRCEVTGQGCDQ